MPPASVGMLLIAAASSWCRPKGTVEALLRAACGCHRRFHKREVEAVDSGCSSSLLQKSALFLLAHLGRSTSAGDEFQRPSPSTARCLLPPPPTCWTRSNRCSLRPEAPRAPANSFMTQCLQVVVDALHGRRYGAISNVSTVKEHRLF